MPKIDKVIVTNNASLKDKYGAGTSDIRAALKRLVAADAQRGLTTKVVGLDDAALGARAVKVPTSPKQNKDAVDAVFAAHEPDYLVILGAIDVVPHQDLTNPVVDDDDDDPCAFGDLPYACSAPYSRRVRDFRGPSRVVGRIPDLVKATDPKYLVGLLDTAAKYKDSARSAYEPYFGVSAEEWLKSTALSLENIFGKSTALQSVPPKKSSWAASLLKAKMHFINCHGGPASQFFLGQRGKNYPIALDAKYLNKKVAPGTVVAAECCYGAELFDPALANGQMGICSTYLANGAYGFFGSSTIAYGPSEGNGSADLITQYFLQRVLAGASLGRAALEARQKFVQSASVLDPADLKTLGQFSLLGDPSIQVVRSQHPALTHTKAYRDALPDGDATNRALRRERLAKFGAAVGQASGAAKVSTKMRPKPKFVRAIEAAARATGVKDLRFASYSVENPAPKLLGSKAVRLAPDAFHVAVARGPVNPGVVPTILFIATEMDGEIVRLRRLHAR